MSASLATRIAEEHTAIADSLSANVVSRERRLNAIAALKEHGLPTSRDENWKYANLRALDRARFAPPTPALLAEPHWAVTHEMLPPYVKGYARYTFVDGVFASALSSPVDPAGISIHSLRSGVVTADAHRSPLRPRASEKDLRFALLNDAFATDGASIRVSPGTNCQACIELVFVATAQATAGASYPRIDLQVETGARVGLIERHVSAGSDSSFINSAARVEVARDAVLHHYRVQQLGTRAIWVDTLEATLGENARYYVHSVDLGALSARSTVHVQLKGERAEVGLYNASVGDQQQVHDTFALVEHVVPNARTEQNFRGISGGRARIAFNGKIVVHKEARGTDSRQSLRGLLAGSNAEIDVRPQLEIYTDDVRCNHGATAGKLDDNMLFYLLSRGLDNETAQRLLKWAFLEDVVAKIEVPELRRQIEQSLAGQIHEAAELKELL